MHYAESIAHIVRDVPGAGLQVERVAGSCPCIAVRYDRERLAATGFGGPAEPHGVQPAGEPAGAIYEHERRFDLVVRADSSRRSTSPTSGGLYVANDRGERLPPLWAADVCQRGCTGSGDARGRPAPHIRWGECPRRDVERLVADIEEQVAAQVDLPLATFVSFEAVREPGGGQASALTGGALALASILALLYFTFRSLPSALLISRRCPRARIGGWRPCSSAACPSASVRAGSSPCSGWLCSTAWCHQHLPATARRGRGRCLGRVRQGTVCACAPC